MSRHFLPVLQNIKDCNYCRKWQLTDPEKGHELVLIQVTNEKILRPKPPDCNACPKFQFDLEDWLPENWKTYQAYCEVQAMGSTLEQQKDERFRHNMAIIWQWMKKIENLEQIEMTTNMLNQTLGKL